MGDFKGLGQLLAPIAFSESDVSDHGKASAFIGEALRLIEQRPSAGFFNANEKRLSESPEYGVKKRQ